ncbi:hypothetical protein [Fructilactobacillus fructivorans]|uniref:hypothetical protein n=1 Tax=Fructilactobacillus fructivorans TaxID=1614 RepID=UPI000704F8AB|nr:hypothetical protein [Fructilactobacillus fructivorans]KRN12954.1 hypothetical protein IV37_GL000587 [Fructilactobacillus fructivorans]KRN40916.1 hypothetical protein IV51_GL001145 [Fructilactobacillus fructivorans]KRN42615.1 hypothetical protein IV48_GL001363 [Fructilactobacillus fructivorans]
MCDFNFNEIENSFFNNKEEIANELATLIESAAPLTKNEDTSNHFDYKVKLDSSKDNNYYEASNIDEQKHNEPTYSSLNNDINSIELAS